MKENEVLEDDTLIDNMAIDDVLESQLSEMRLLEFNKGNLESEIDTSRDQIFKLMLKRAKYIALDTLYPFDLEKDELPKRIQDDWQVRCACELFEKIDSQNVQSYSENNLSITYFTGLLSNDLMKELTPKAGVPK